MSSATFSSDTKDALARDLPENDHCRAALLDALLAYGVEKTHFVTRRSTVARLVKSLLRERNGEAGAISTIAGRRLDRAPAYAIAIPPKTLAEIARPTQKCDRAMEVRAALMTCGSLAAGAHGYHLEFVVADRGRADRLALMLRSLGRAPKEMERKGRVVLYYKDFDAIVDVLGQAGAFAAVLHLEDVRALRETKNRIHRLVNTEAANLERAAGAGASQERTIRFLESAYGLHNLTPALREIADLRLQHPDESLAELGKRCNPQISKPTVNSRLVALAQLERRLKGAPTRTR